MLNNRTVRRNKNELLGKKNTSKNNDNDDDTKKKSNIKEPNIAHCDWGVILFEKSLWCLAFGTSSK